MRDGILSKEDSSLILDLLDLKGHKDRKAFRRQRAEGIDLSCADG